MILGKIRTDEVLRPILILDPNKRSHTRGGKEYGHKTRKGEATTSKSYEKLKIHTNK